MPGCSRWREIWWFLWCVLSLACTRPSHLSSQWTCSNGSGPDGAVKTYLLLKISAGRKSCRDDSPACYPACQPRNVSLCLSFHVKTLQVYSAYFFFLPYFSLPSSVGIIRSPLLSALWASWPDQAPDQIGSVGGEVALCFLIHDGEAVHSLSACLFLLVLCQSFRALFQPPLNIPLKIPVSAQNQRQADAEIEIRRREGAKNCKDEEVEERGCLRCLDNVRLWWLSHL